MAYNKAKEEWKWKQWKEKEEEQLRALGTDEKVILELRRRDWEEFIWNIGRHFRNMQIGKT